MLNAFLWGLVATSSLLLGGVIGSRFTIGKRALGIIMGFGAGVLFSAVAYELVFEALHLGAYSGFPGVGFLAGAFTFFFIERLVGKIGAGGRSDSNPARHSTLIVPMVLGIVLDGIPESTVIGLGLLEGGTVSVAMLVAVFMSNLPEAIAGTTGMVAAAWSRSKIILLWSAITVICSLAAVAGFALFGNESPSWLAFTHAFAGGAILMMMANTMIPEAYERGGKLDGGFHRSRICALSVHRPPRTRLSRGLSPAALPWERNDRHHHGAAGKSDGAGADNCHRSRHHAKLLADRPGPRPVRLPAPRDSPARKSGRYPPIRVFAT